MILDNVEQEAVSLARQLLEEAGVWDSEGDLKCLVDRFLVRANKKQALDEFMIAVDERCNRIPLGHIVGTVAFDEMSLVVGSGVFIPRAHSTIIHKWLGDIQLGRGAQVLDLCAGSGAIGLGIARRRPDLIVTCVELDEVALQYLSRNIARMAVKGIQARALRADVHDTSAFSRFAGQVELIVANPPYVPEGLELLPEWSSHHPPISVYSGGDGLELIRQIISLGVDLLIPQGWLVIEHGEEQGQAVRQLFEQHGLTDVRTVVDQLVSDSTGSSVISVGRRSTKFSNQGAEINE
ncbi:N5-glutamine methyltransferase family protein [Pseudomonas guariconensis]|uniref:N5-glutamine methyltransferase family protein n=1 Tax=Pseudomonas guariconensis TaxID=1288410 RepID=UPI0018AB2764|nr:HemK/PrmC family methyltransferase [Pseudomonas guariconensis]MBF8740972.1 peptide chain release factor N(5)-glutamine methyltransferase [Pseudomonas guariconensis]MBF8750332.1 peptide chain release factor N(5)-glutamine methyltransferase [Pseudomonas guariconensis]